MLNIQATPIPITIDEHGTARIANTRVTLDVFITAFKQGATAEEIAQQFTSLQLADIYAVITYYLRETHVVEAYLQKRQEKAAKIREEIETAFPPQGIRARLLAKRKAMNE